MKWSDIFDRVSRVVRKSRKKDDFSWRWVWNMRCKYITLRIDMRDGHCILTDADDKEITIEELEYQNPCRNKSFPIEVKSKEELQDSIKQLTEKFMNNMSLIQNRLDILKDKLEDIDEWVDEQLRM